jgi:kinesin family protein 15
MVCIQNHWVILEQEELSILKRQNVSRSLSFGLTSVQDTTEEQENACTTNIHNMDQQRIDDLLGYESKGIVRMSTKQVCFTMQAYNSPIK